MKPDMRSNDTPSHANLKMVADKAGVSISTASRVMSNSTNVSAAKRAAVQAAASGLGFVVNGVARALVAGRSRTVGVIAQHIESPFYGLALRGAEETLSRAGYALVVSSGHCDRMEEEHCVQFMRTRQVDGIIVLTGSLEDQYLKKVAEHLPIVVTGRKLVAPGLHSLHVNDYAGAFAATRFLIDLGHARIAHIAGHPAHTDAHDRERGYRDALASAGLTIDEALIVVGNYHEDSGTMAAESLLAGNVQFSAIFAANDQMASGATLALHRRGRRVPEDVSIVGFDDLSAARHCSPPRTTVSLSIAELGRRAATAMLDLLSGRLPTVSAPEPELVVRASTASRAAG
jgi:LacI family transcriptional regulator